MLLLLASYYFYMCWKMEYIFLILACTLVHYTCGLQMGRLSDKRKRRKYLVISILFSLGSLFVFKYLNFFSDSVRTVFSKFNIAFYAPTLRVLVPIGISFYTFKALSYTIDVYRGRIKPEKHLGIFALYVAFFPQLLAGPIERATKLLPQFRRNNEFNPQRLNEGFGLMLCGLFKKVVIADRLGLYVNGVYNNVYDHQGLPLLIATYFFTFQIYCDFSGYSDIAIGAAKAMGYDTTINFDRPYFAKSIPEFWKRWHISLSDWFKDYLYIPLGGNRCSRGRWYINILVVFLLSGIWHGANWTFVVWGALHGIWLILSVSATRIMAIYPKLPRIGVFKLKLIKVFVTFHLICFGWIFFRSNSVSDALYVISHMFIDITNISGLTGVLGRFDFLISMISIAALLFVNLLERSRPNLKCLNFEPVILRWSCYCIIIFGIIALGITEQSQFIYFKF